MTNQMETLRAARTRRWLTGLMAALVLAPSLYGFSGKFVEFVRLFRGDPSGLFAISPIMNYLLASLGFLCLFGWAMAQGTFRDIEAPKYSMLEIEAALDARQSRRKDKQ